MTVGFSSHEEGPLPLEASRGSHWVIDSDREERNIDPDKRAHFAD